MLTESFAVAITEHISNEETNSAASDWNNPISIQRDAHRSFRAGQVPARNPMEQMLMNAFLNQKIVVRGGKRMEAESILGAFFSASSVSSPGMIKSYFSSLLTTPQRQQEYAFTSLRGRLSAHQHNLKEVLLPLTTCEAGTAPRNTAIARISPIHRAQFGTRQATARSSCRIFCRCHAFLLLLLALRSFCHPFSLAKNWNEEAAFD